MCVKQPCLAFFQWCLIQVSHFVDKKEVSLKELTLTCRQVYIDSKCSAGIYYCLPSPLQVCHVIWLIKLEQFSICLYWPLLLFHSFYTTTQWTCLSKFWKGIISGRIILVPVCWEEQVGWRRVTFSSCILTVFLTTISGQLFQCSAINWKWVFISFDSSQY